MSQENVEIVRAAFAAWNAGDMDALRELVDPDVFMRAPQDWPETGPFVGRDAVMREWEQLRETFDTDWQELSSDVLDSGDRALVRTVWHGVGHGPEMKQESTVVFSLRNWRILQIEFFSDHMQALKAVGLAE
jgi:ketosteroid isomerase-like protein